MNPPDPYARLLLGTAVGDSLALPAEGLARSTIQRRWHGSIRHRFLFGHGMVSDDTEHSVFVAQCLLRYPDSVEKFQKALAWRLRGWILCLPAGVGFATLRSICKLWLGFPPTHSGVRSAGNGPAMRSAIIGAFFANDKVKLRSYVAASTRLTHTDPRAEIAALAVALTARRICCGGDDQTLAQLWKSAGPDNLEWQNLVDKMRDSLERKLTLEEFALELSCPEKISGYAFHSVPAALYAWARYSGDFEETMGSIIRCGGDTDSIAAIAGGLAALDSEIPEDWLRKVWDFPISLTYLRKLGGALQNRNVQVAPWFAWPLLPFRNILFLSVVLLHGFRRLLP